MKLGAYDYIVKRDNYLTHLPYAIDNAIARFQLVELNRRLRTELEERKRLQQSTAESLALLDTLQIHAPIGIAFIDDGFRFRRVNDEMAAIDGVTVAGHLGQPVFEILPDLWSKIEPLCRAVLKGESVRNVEISGETPAQPGEKRHWLASFYPVRSHNPDTLGIGAIVKEVTEEKRPRPRCARMPWSWPRPPVRRTSSWRCSPTSCAIPLRPCARHSSCSSASASNALSSTALTRSSADRSRTWRACSTISSTSPGSRAGRITLNPQEVDLRDVVSEGIDSTRALIDARRHDLVTDLSGRPLLIRGDTTRLVQVFVNLLNNAAKYTDEHGTIRVTAAAEGTQAVVRVVDTGTGISPRLLPTVFDVFTQDDRALDRAQGGLGLGLTLVRRITELHGGSCRGLQRGPWTRKRVRCQVAVTRSRRSGGRVPRSRSPAPAQPSLRCLVVDDNIDAARMLECALTLEGHQVRLAFDGRDAIEGAAAFQPDAIVLDIGLPRMNGYEAARAIRELPGLANVLIIAATGYGQDVDCQRSREAGFDHHLVKPIDLDALLHALAGGQ